jgi:hypothetical protein
MLVAWIRKHSHWRSLPAVRLATAEYSLDTTSHTHASRQGFTFHYSATKE